MCLMEAIMLNKNNNVNMQNFIDHDLKPMKYIKAA